MLIKKNTLRKWIILLMMIYFCWYPHISKVNGKLLYIILLPAFLMSLLVFVFSFRKNNHVSIYQAGWIVILALSLIRNWGISTGNYLWPVVFSCLIVTLLALSTNTKWHKTFFALALAFCSVYILATLFFLIVPSAYPLMKAFWQSWPNGTEYGAFGYRAGIADTHSGNGSYCIIPLLVSASLLLAGVEKKRNRKLLLCMAVVSALAVALTTKRAHLAFGFLTLLLVYYYFSKRRMSSKLFKILGVIACALVAYSVIPNIIALSNFTSGFFDYVGSDVTNGRLAYWVYALSLFAKNPAFGIGWLGFRYNSQPLLFNSTHEGFSRIGYVDAHNVYLQLLCETGVIGTAITLTVMIAFLYSTVRLFGRYKASLTTEQKQALAVSFCFQVFCLLYGLSGNFLYDRVAFVYIFGCALFCSVMNEVRITKRVRKKIFRKKHGENV